jgi:archaellum component FlaG (FlaF/FlaG flagellin family)
MIVKNIGSYIVIKGNRKVNVFLSGAFINSKPLSDYDKILGILKEHYRKENFT